MLLQGWLHVQARMRALRAQMPIVIISRVARVLSAGCMRRSAFAAAVAPAPDGRPADNIS